jgi:hypothetical protein
VFRRDQSLYVYLEAYEPALTVDKKAGLVAAVSFFRGKTKAFETAPVGLTETAAQRRNVLPIRFEVPLAKLAPGPYICQVSVIDGVAKKFAFPRARVMVVP